MELNLERVESIKNRMNVSYKEAKEALEACDGNELDAMILLEAKGYSAKKDNKRASSVFSSFLQSITKFIHYLHSVKFTVLKEDRPIFTLPITVLLVFAIFMMPLLVISIIIGWASGLQYVIKRPALKKEEVMQESF